MSVIVRWDGAQEHYVVSTPAYECIVRPEGTVMGVHSLRHRESGREWIACWTKQQGYMGIERGDRLCILNPYHYLARNLPIGVTGREMPARHHARGEEVVVELAPTEDCAIATTLVYKFSDSPLIELRIEVMGHAEYPDLEVWLSSYVLGRRNRPHFWCRDKERGASWVAPVRDRFVKDYYLAFPRDNKAAAMTFDGRWGDPHYQTFLNGPYYAQPLMAVAEEEGLHAYVEFGRREEVAKIAGRYGEPDWSPASAGSDYTPFYTVLFGQDLKEGQRLSATVCAGVLRIDGDIDRVRSYLPDLREAP